MPFYTPLGEMLSDLHDRPERMVAKGVVKAIVPWAEARPTFYWHAYISSEHYTHTHTHTSSAHDNISLKARSTFYWRLKRRMLEEQLISQVLDTS